MADYDTGESDTTDEDTTTEDTGSDDTTSTQSSEFVTDVDQYVIVSDFADFQDLEGVTQEIADAVESGDATELGSYDTDDDGTDDIVEVDFNGDDSADATLYDSDADGKVDTIQFDETGDGVVDTALIDSDGDGVADTVLAGGDDTQWGVSLSDEDQDGEFDSQMTYDTSTGEWVEGEETSTDDSGSTSLEDTLGI